MRLAFYAASFRPLVAVLASTGLAVDASPYAGCHVLIPACFKGTLFKFQFSSNAFASQEISDEPSKFQACYNPFTASSLNLTASWSRGVRIESSRGAAGTSAARVVFEH